MLVQRKFRRYINVGTQSRTAIIKEDDLDQEGIQRQEYFSLKQRKTNVLLQDSSQIFQCKSGP